ncbi:hypothetical protein D3C80_1649010 [compost metagenome]
MQCIRYEYVLAEVILLSNHNDDTELYEQDEHSNGANGDQPYNPCVAQTDFIYFPIKKRARSQGQNEPIENKRNDRYDNKARQQHI